MTHVHDHDEPPRDPAQAPGPMDPAQKSLADALRVSFRILTVIMIFMVGVYLFTGVKFIEPQQVGILKIFGKEVGTAREGLTYTWPFPIGEIELVSTREKELTVNSFWMHETAADKTRKLLARTASGKGLRPGWDGALLTGDRNLLHVRLSCTYRIRRPVAYRMHVRPHKDDRFEQEMVRSVICRAAIRAAAKRTADAIQRAQQEEFKKDVHDFAQQELNVLFGTQPGEEAVQISQVLLKDASWPLKALSAYNQAQQASNEKDKRISAAKAEAAEILNAACGPRNVKKLVGDLLDADRSAGSAAASAPATRPAAVDLIGKYADALADKQTPQAADLLRQIDEVLVGPDTVGDASRILAEARSDRTAIKQDAQKRAERFAKLVGEYRRAPQFMLERLWAETRDEILSSPTVEKFYVTFGSGKAVVRINRDPDVKAQIERERRKKKKANETGQKPK